MNTRGRGQIEVADIFRRYGPLYRSAHPMPVNRLRAMRAIETCRTADQGGHVDECRHCGTKVTSYNSCRNRHCPKCQFLKKEQWIEAREKDLLPIPYFHVVFTIPDLLNPLVLRNQEILYGLLFKAVSENRDEVAHYGKTDWFAFQILNSDGRKEIIPPRFTSSQPLRIAFRISYENLLVFIQDFIAALVQPYLFSDFIAFTFQDEEIVTSAPKWYIMVKAFQQFGLKSISSNPSILMQFYQSRPCPIDLEECINVHRYYGSFYKQ